MNEIISGALLRSILAFILVTVLARVMGRKLIANMTFFDFVGGVTIGATTANYQGLSKDLIMDGCLLRENLNDVHLNEEWLRQQLRNQGIPEVMDVFYAGLDSAGNLYVSEKQPRTEKHGQYGIE